MVLKLLFEIFTKEFLNHIENSVLILPYIYNELKDSKYNWHYQKRNVLEYFQAAINASKLKKDEFFIMQERNLFCLFLLFSIFTPFIKFKLIFIFFNTF